MGRLPHRAREGCVCEPMYCPVKGVVCAKCDEARCVIVAACVYKCAKWQVGVEGSGSGAM